VAPNLLTPRFVPTSANERFTENEIPMGEIIDKVKGKIKQAAGAAAGNKKLENEGKADEVKGKAKGAFEEIKHAVKDAARK